MIKGIFLLKMNFCQPDTTINYLARLKQHFLSWPMQRYYKFTNVKTLFASNSH